MSGIWRNLITALGLGVAVYLILSLVAGLDNLRAAAANFEYALIPAILGLVLLSYAGRFLRWLYYLRLLKVSVPLGTNAAIFAAGLSMAISPGKLGEVLKSVFVRRVNGAPIARTAPAIVAERATDATGMVLWGLIGALAFSFGLGVLVLFILATILAIAALRSKRLSLLVERILSKLPLLNRLAPRVHDFHASSNELLSTRPLVVGTVVSFLSWGLECVAVYLCAVGMGAERPFLVVVFIFAVSSLAGALFFTPGGIGVAEGSLAGMFVSVAGLAGGISVALTFVIRLATLWFAALVGIVGLLVVRYIIGNAGPVDPAEQER
ncbi:MAG: lysylphosphatidylglycerol synthase transmembrane domain-containing protein [Rubrobacteraceae bacterium]